MTGFRPAIDCGHDPVDAAMWLARAFTAGRRLCVWAPGAPDHAHHVAVEFVHPVVAGTRPLAATVAESEAAAGTSADARLAIGGNRRAADLFISSDQTDTAIVLSYHVLWELVQVALEHPGLVGSAAAAGGDYERAAALHHALMPLSVACFMETNPGPVKAALGESWETVGDLRLPMVAPAEETLRAVMKALAALDGG